MSSVDTVCYRKVFEKEEEMGKRVSRVAVSDRGKASSRPGMERKNGAFVVAGFRYRRYHYGYVRASFYLYWYEEFSEQQT
jgi:hypothetical protein